MVLWFLILWLRQKTQVWGCFFQFYTKAVFEEHSIVKISVMVGKWSSFSLTLPTPGADLIYDSNSVSYSQNQLWLLIYGDSDFMYDLCASRDQEFSHGKCVKEAKLHTASLSPEQRSFSYDPQQYIQFTRAFWARNTNKWIPGQSHIPLCKYFPKLLYTSQTANLLIFLLAPRKSPYF